MENKIRDTSLPASNASSDVSPGASIGFGQVMPVTSLPTVSSVGGAPKPPPQPIAPQPDPTPSVTPPKPAGTPISWKKIIKYGGLAVLALLIIGGIIAVWINANNRSKLGNLDNLSRFNTVQLPLSDLASPEGGLSLLGTRSLVINGPLVANDGFTISPSTQPSNANKGQIYFDSADNKLAYYNGTTFVKLDQSSQITAGGGVLVQNNQIINTGVLSVQGQTGNVTLNAGNGIAISGTTFTNTGVISAAGGSGITVTNDGNGNITITNSGAGSGTVSSPGGTAGRIAKFTGVQTVADSLLSESGAVVTVGGNLSVTGSLTLGTALAVGNGGTGNTSLANNGVVVGQGAGALTAVTAGGSGLCLMSTAGAPAFQACPGGGGVTSLNGLTGVLSVANASGAGSTITINDASTAQKGIAQFNSTNFTAASGTINTIQNINTGATPTFAGVNTNTVTPSGAFTLGATGQAFTLQGSATSVITATGGGFTTTIGFSGVPTGAVTYQFDRSVAPNTYTVCSTAGNCAGVGGGVTTGGGTTNRLPKFTGAQTIGDSTITDNGTSVSTTGDLVIQGGDVTVGVASSQTGTINFAHSASANIGSIVQGALGASRTYTLPDASGTFCLTSGNCSGTGSSNTLQAAYDAGNIINTTVGRDINFNLTDQATDPNFLVNLQCVTACSTNGRFAVQNGGTDVFSVAPNGGAVMLQNKTNSASALRVLNALGTTTVLGVDTATPKVVVQGTSTNGSGGRLEFGNDGNVAIYEATGDPDVLTFDTRVGFSFKNTSSGLETVHIDGQNGLLTVKSLNNSFGGLLATQSNDHSVLFADPSGTGSVHIGYNADAQANLLYLDADATSEPAGANGAMYYNASLGKFRCYENGAWVNCLPNGGGGAAFVQGGNAFGATANLGTNDAFDLAIRRGGTTQLTVGSGNVTLASNVDLLMQGATAYISNPQGQTNSESFGLNAVINNNGQTVIGANANGGGSTNTTVVGNGAVANSGAAVVVGQGADAGFNATSVGQGSHTEQGSVAVGGSAISNAHNNVVLGYLAQSNQTSSIAIGAGAVTSAANQLVIGSDTVGGDATNISKAIIGNGVTNATPLGFTLQGTSGNGTNVAGASTTIAAGQGTGTALGGNILFQSSLAGASGSSLNSLATLATLSTTSLTMGTNLDVLLQGSTAYFSNPQGQTNGESFGLNAAVTGANGTAVGNGAAAVNNGVAVGYQAGASSGAFGGPISIGQGANGGSWGVAIGQNTTNGGNNNVAVGNGSNAAGDNAIVIGSGSLANQNSIVIGESASSGGNDRIVLGTGASATADDQFVAGSSTHAINHVIFGNGVTNGTPTGFTLQSTGGQGTDVAGSNITVAAGQGTGAALGGNILFQSSLAGGTGSSPNSLTTLGTLSTTSLTMGTNLDVILQGSTAYFTNTQGQTNAEAFGNGATVNTSGGTAVGHNSSTGGFGDSVAIGNNAIGINWGVAIGGTATTTSNFGVAIGNGATAGLGGTAVGASSLATSGSTVLGYGATTTGTLDSIAIGQDAATTDWNQFVVGSSTHAILNTYFGNGVVNATPDNITINATGGNGTNVAGASLNLGGGKGTGNANGGNINLQISKPGASGSSNNALTTVGSFSGADGSAQFQNATDSTSAFKVLNAAGTTPLFQIDTTNSRVYVGNPTADGTGALLVLDTKNTTGDPSGVDGAMYYNSAMARMRCYYDGGWHFCGEDPGLTYTLNIQDDFFVGNAGRIGQYDWQEVFNGTGAGYNSVAPDSNQRIGVVAMDTGTTLTGYDGIFINSPGGQEPILLGGNEIIEMDIKFPNLATVGDDYVARVGLCDNINTDCTDGAYFEYNRATSTNWIFATANNSTRTKTTSTTAVSTNWVHLKMVVNSAASRIDYYIDNVNVGNITTNIPTAAGRYTQPEFTIVKTAGTTSRTINIDYFQMRNSFTTAR